MEKFRLTMIAASVVLFTSCYTIEQVSIDYLIPAIVNTPKEIKRVGVVNNTSPIEGVQIEVMSIDSIQRPGELTRKVDYYWGDAKVATEALAESIAEQDYFDAVLINDSVLRAADIHPREATLSPSEINELALDMDVDMLISLEQLLIKSIRIISQLPDYTIYQGTIDATVYPALKLYIPNRKLPMTTITAKDSIFWEDYHRSMGSLQTGIISQEKLIEEASYFAGTILMKYLTPYWKTEERNFFGGSSSLMRDAAIYAKEDNWDEAFELWQEEYKSKKDKKKMMAAYNIALYYEMKDEIEKALQYANEALELTKENTDYHHFTSLYVINLSIRKEYLHKLEAQMKRF